MRRTGMRRSVGLMMCGILGSILTASVGLAEPPKGWNWKLTWSDEFEGKELDLTKWSYRLGERRDGKWVKEAVTLDGKGNLILRSWSKDGENYSGAIFSPSTFLHRYGYYEIRCEFPDHGGHWASFWLQSPIYGQPPHSPRHVGAEVDIFEYDQPGTDRLSHNIHWGNYGEYHEHVGHISEVPGLKTGFHTVGLLWTPEEYVIYIDGREMWRTTYGVSQRPLYIDLTDEVQYKAWIDLGELPPDFKLPDDRFTVDYIRVYDWIDELKPELKENGAFLQMMEIQTSDEAGELLRGSLLRNLPRVLKNPATQVRQFPLLKLRAGEMVVRNLRNNKAVEADASGDGSWETFDVVSGKLEYKEIPGRGKSFVLVPVKVDSERRTGWTTGENGTKTPVIRYDRSQVSEQMVNEDTWYILGDYPVDETAKKRTFILYRLLVSNYEASTQPAK